ncbi:MULTISPECIES: DUF2321 domain-containing protein [Rhizobium]|uniref:DUF2321 domain-containing protein n=1 Tax=Rhizobium TaxID=379 RepID=UPI0007E9AAE3|nr:MULTISPECIES: DUF2321 domain-containing protein [Rhizobium]ANK85648.1 hypothetical protein AMK02_CH02064 [Rhizobium sp. N731]ANL15895.1 hypothetical protein AMJ97_CH02063 [Rhizobium sp. N1314]ANM04133.1 hypothetical protein AMC78_CH02040 [Rhizobium phaseoli]
MAEYFRIGQACLNGHKITGEYGDADTSKFCPTCGEPEIHACPNCESKLRGDHIYDGYVSFTDPFKVTSFCHDCGKPFPWTERQIQAAQELADEIVEIDRADLDRAKAALIALTSDTPQTAVAVVRVKKMLEKAGPIIGGGIKDILVGIVTEAAKKALGW